MQFSTNLHTKNTKICQSERSLSSPLVFRSLHIKYVSERQSRYVYNVSKPIFIVSRIPVNLNRYPSLSFNSYKCFIHTSQDNIYNSDKNKEQYINDLFKDRVAPVIPFDRNLIKGSCLNNTDKISKAKFLKEWGSKAGIYLIEYKHYLNIYYIGRTNLLKIKKILFEHSKAESQSKFHLFMCLTGIEHFNLHILEVCAETK